MATTMTFISILVVIVIIAIVGSCALEYVEGEAPEKGLRSVYASS